MPAIKFKMQADNSESKTLAGLMKLKKGTSETRVLQDGEALVMDKRKGLHLVDDGLYMMWLLVKNSLVGENKKAF